MHVLPHLLNSGKSVADGEWIAAHSRGVCPRRTFPRNMAQLAVQTVHQLAHQVLGTRLGALEWVAAKDVAHQTEHLATVRIVDLDDARQCCRIVAWDG